MRTAIATPEAYRLFHEGQLALAQVEHNGFCVDTDYLDKVTAETEGKIKEQKAKLQNDPIFATWQGVFGSRTNLGSGEQLGHVLFSMMGYKAKSFTATGRPSVDESAFDRINLPFVKDYVRLKKLEKLRGTYLEGLRREVVDGKVHCSFNLHLVSTYRSSCDGPNLQNIPVRDPTIASVIRRCFVARKGHQLVELDFKGLEVVIAACYHQDPVMMEYIRDPSKDMHRDMAAEIYMLDKDEVSKNTRYVAKNRFVFPAFYGSYYKQMTPDLWEAARRMKLRLAIKNDPEKSGSGKSLMLHLKEQGIERRGKCDKREQPQSKTFEEHVRKVEESFWGNRFGVYAQWKKDWWAAYQRSGSFAMKTGFVVCNVHKRNDVLNYPVQGSAFHCLLQSLIWLQKWLIKHRMRSRIVCQIHDSILVDVHPKERDAVIAKAKEIMSVLLPKRWTWIIVPLGVEVEVCPVDGSWHDKKELK